MKLEEIRQKNIKLQEDSALFNRISNAAKLILERDGGWDIEIAIVQDHSRALSIDAHHSLSVECLGKIKNLIVEDLERGGSDALSRIKSIGNEEFKAQ